MSAGPTVYLAVLTIQTGPSDGTCTGTLREQVSVPDGTTRDAVFESMITRMIASLVKQRGGRPLDSMPDVLFWSLEPNVLGGSR